MLIGITGATGGLGRRLTEILLERGCSVRCLIRNGSNLNMTKSENLEVVTGELSDMYSLAKFVEGIDICVHIAAQVTATSKEALFKTNVTGTKNLCKAIEDNNRSCRLVHCSSIVVRELLFYQKPFVSNYTMSKYYAERVVDQYSKKIKTTIIYPGYIFGKYDRALMPYIIDMLQNGLKFWIKGGEKNAPIIYVDDLCELFYQVIMNKDTVGKKYVSLERQEKGMHYVIQLIASRLNYPVPRRTYPKYAIRIYLKFNALMSNLFGVNKIKMSLRSLNILSNHAKHFNNAFEDIGWKQKYTLDEIVKAALDDYMQSESRH